MKTLGFLIAMFLVIHAGVKVVPMLMDYTRMTDEMKMKAGVAQVLNDEAIRADLVRMARELDLPLDAESFVIDRDGERRRMRIKTRAGWDVTISFLWGTYVKTFHFDPQVDESFLTVRL